MNQKLDRRKFLAGAGGALLALPMLETFAPRVGFADVPAPPKRVLFVFHAHGRPIGNGKNGNDNWSPGTAGALPDSGPISPALEALGPIRDKIVTIDGIDNIVRAATGDPGGHGSAGATALTCAMPIYKGFDHDTATGPSIDYVVGERLRANASMQPSIVFPAQYAGAGYGGYWFRGPGGSPPYKASSRPEQVIEDLFAGIQQPDMPPSATPSLHDRLVSRRVSILDGVAKSFQALRGKLNAADRDRLDQHAEFIQAVEKSLAGGATLPTESCVVPDVGAIPSYAGTNDRGQKDAITTPYQIENVIQALACDITRVAALEFHASYQPVFPSELPNGGKIVSSGWHTLIHGTPSLTSDDADLLTTAFQYFAKSFTKVVQRLEQLTDVDGHPMLDSTLVVWLSDMGYGASHYDWNLPVVMAGMPSAFPNGQGRHVVMNRRTLGDLYAQILRMVGGTDTTFGETGKLGDLSSDPFTSSGMDVTTATPLHMGPIDL